MVDCAGKISPEGILERVLEDPYSFGLPTVFECTRINSGIVHFVWKLQTAERAFYLKIRGHKFAKLPIDAVPEHISNEAQATAILGSLVAMTFPDVVSCHPSLGVLIETDVIENGSTLERLWQERKVTDMVMSEFGTTLRRVHDAGRYCRPAIRKNQEMQFAAAKLSHKLGFAGSDRLNSLIDAMTASCFSRQLILGDPSPKNVGVRQSTEGMPRVSFFDLEDAHDGFPAYDFGFSIGHTILHNAFSSSEASRFVKVFIDGYGRSCEPFFDALRSIALGTILYRLESVVPYAQPLVVSGKKALAARSRRLLDRPDLENIPWDAFVNEVLEN